VIALTYVDTLLNLQELNEELRYKTPHQIVRWVSEVFGDRLAMQSSMQKTAGVLMHMVSQIAPETEVIFVDTGVHFPETLELRDEFAQRFGLKIKTYSPPLSFDEQYNQTGYYMHEVDDTSNDTRAGYRACCRLRKELPFIDAVQGKFDAVISGLMRHEGGARGNVDVISWDKRIKAYKVNPLAYWTPAHLEAYTAEHELPVHKLYGKGFPSIGCWTCTTPVMPGEDARAGRWRHIKEKNSELRGTPIYCGINFEDKGSGI